MDREEIVRLFEGKSIPYVFNRVNVDTTITFARSTIKVRGSLLEEELGLSKADSLVLEMLLGEHYVDFYQYIIDPTFDKTTQERKLHQFSVSLYDWTSRRLGYIPDWILEDRVLHIGQIVDVMLKESERVMTDSEILLGILIKNTEFPRNKLFEEQLARGVWGKAETGQEELLRAEGYYLKGQTDKYVDSLSLYKRLAERGYRDVDMLERYIKGREFTEYVITDVERVQESLRDYMWKYRNGEDWEGFTDKFYETISSVGIPNIKYERVNPNQVMVRDRESRYSIQYTFSDRVVINMRKDQRLLVVYNEPYYMSSFESIVEKFAGYQHLTSKFVKINGALLKNMPMEIPKKREYLKKWDK